VVVKGTITRSATKHGNCAPRRERLTSVLSAEAFSPHETHFCVLGSGIGLRWFRKSAPRDGVAWYWRVLFVDLALRETWLSESFGDLEMLFVC